MPWSSDQQRKWGHTTAGKKALGGEAAVHEWDEATKGKKLPEKVAKSSGSFGLSEKNVGISKPSIPSATTKMPNPAKTGIPSVRTPKAKKMPGAFSKPSVFFKSETAPKHPSVRKLWDFLCNVKKI
jgi:hypothetical protein